jgi:hypothetical protein
MSMTMSSSSSSLSLSDLGLDPLFRIIEYLAGGALKDLQSLGLTSHFVCQLVFHDYPGLFRGQKRDYWKDLYQLRALVDDYPQRRRRRRQQIQRQSQKRFHSLGVLSKTLERNVLAYDHPAVIALDENERYGRRELREDEQTTGYFGFQILPKEVAVYGDYSGISFFPSVDSFVTEDDQQRKPNGWLFGDCYQVMAVHQEESFLFLGFASGTIHCISTVHDNSDIQEYPYISCNSETHSNEITCLAKAGTLHLASGGSKQGTTTADVVSDVFLHWNALQDGNLDHVSRLSLTSSGPALSVASSSFSYFYYPVGQGPSIMNYVTYGASNGSIVVSLWDDDTLFETNTFSCVFENPLPGHVVFLEYMSNPLQATTTQCYNHHHQQRLVIGTSLGNVYVAQHDVLDHTHQLEMMYTLEACCPGGCVDAVQLVGSVLITAGASNGKIYCWDWNSGASLCSLQIHPGRLYYQTRLHSAVIDIAFCKERSSLICLCRDGYVEEWSIRDEWNTYLTSITTQQEQQEQQHDTTQTKKRLLLPNSVAPPKRRSRRLSSRLTSSNK